MRSSGWKLEGHTGRVSGARALGDGRMLSWAGGYESTDHTLRLWDGATGAPLATLEGHTHKVTGALALDGGHILSWSRDTTLRLWDATTGATLARLEGHTGSVYGALALTDGRILSWDSDQTRLWDGATGPPLRVFAAPSDWRDADADADADLIASLRPDERAWQHSLHLGFHLAVAEGDRAVFTGGRHLRLCRFVGRRGTAEAGEAGDLPDAD